MIRKVSEWITRIFGAPAMARDDNFAPNFKSDTSLSAHEPINPANTHDFSSAQYWENRYAHQGTSGHGSYGRLAKFKAEVINNFILKNNITQMIDFGCGDGHQISMIQAPHYIGVDVSPTVVSKCIELHPSKAMSFLTAQRFKRLSLTAELTTSLDVIFHLVEDEIYDQYMHMLFSSSTRYCIIYSSNTTEIIDPAKHVRHRKFTDWIEANAPAWNFIDHVKNIYPHDGSINSRDTSFCDFYFYQRK